MSSVSCPMVDQQDRYGDMRRTVLCAVQRFLAQHPLSPQHPFIQSAAIAPWPEDCPDLHLKEPPTCAIRHVQIRLHAGDLIFSQAMRLASESPSWHVAVYYIRDDGHDVEGCHFSGRGDALHVDNLQTMLPYRLDGLLSNRQLDALGTCIGVAIENMLRK